GSARRGGSSSVGSSGETCRSNFNGWGNQQAAGTCWRYASHRRRHLRKQCHLRSFRDRRRRIFYPRNGWARCLSVDGIPGHVARRCSAAALDKVAKLGGKGGLIAIDQQGNIVLPFNTAGMYRGYVDPNG